MGNRLILAICSLVLLGAPAFAADNAPAETLGQFLARCDSGAAGCRSDLAYGFETAANDMGIICPPAELSEDEAVDAELKWLRDAADSNSTLAGGDEVDAEFDALNSLWPCSQ